MARIPTISDEAASPAVRTYFEGCRRLLGRVPNSARTYAHTPVVARWYLPFLVTLQREGAGSLLDLRTKELAVLKTSMTNGCAY
jgi:alkylhydroperoxidase family enzyme